MISANDEYLQNFAIWTSARAVNRGFAKTEVIKKALEKIDLLGNILNLSKCTNFNETKFDEWHSLINSNLKKELCESIELNKVTFGRTAKIIAIYIKTFHIIKKPNDLLSKFAHVPIDSILLKNLSNYDKSLKKIKWTKLNENEYCALIYKLRKRQEDEGFKYFWMLEKEYWKI